MDWCFSEALSLARLYRLYNGQQSACRQLIQILQMLHLAEKTGHRPITLMGGGTDGRRIRLSG